MASRRAADVFGTPADDGHLERRAVDERWSAALVPPDPSPPASISVPVPLCSYSQMGAKLHVLQSPLSRCSNASISKGMLRSGSLNSARMRATPSRTDAAA